MCKKLENHSLATIFIAILIIAGCSIPLQAGPPITMKQPKYLCKILRAAQQEDPNPLNLSAYCATTQTESYT